MNNETRYFLTDSILDDSLEQQLGARNFKSLNEDNDGLTLKRGYKTSLNICDILEDDVTELTMVSDNADVPIENGVAYLGAMGLVEIWIFPKNGSPGDGITIYVEVYAKDGLDLAEAIGNDDLDTIYLGEGIYPGFTVARAVRIVGCGLGTMVVPFEEYSRVDNPELYRRGIMESIARLDKYAGLGDNDLGLGTGDGYGYGYYELGYALGSGYGTGTGNGVGYYRCNLDSSNCLNSFVYGNNALTTGDCRPRTNRRLNLGRVNPDNAIIRVAASNIYLEDITIAAQGIRDSLMIGIAFASRQIRTTIYNVGASRVAMALPEMEAGAIGIYANDSTNVFIGDSVIDIARSAGNAASLAICGVEQTKVDGFMSNTRMFLGGTGCENKIEFMTRIMIIEDYLAIEEDGGAVQYGELPLGDINGMINAVLRDDSNDFDGLTIYNQQYPDYLAIYFGAAKNYVVLVKRNLVGCS